MNRRSQFLFHRLSQLALIISAITTTFGGAAQAYTVNGGTWPGRPATITYSYSNLLNGNLGGSLTNGELRLAVEEALNVWAMHAPLNFIERTDSGPSVTDTDYPAAGHPIIRIGHHAQTAGAHAYFPPGPDNTNQGRGGDIHLNSSVDWGLYTGGDILATLVHELGHALGLGHESTTPAIMHPDPWNADFGNSPYLLSGTAFVYPDDISGIRARYGTGVGSVQPLAQATSRTWTNTSTGDLLTNANWNGASPNAKGAAATLNAIPGGSGSFTLNDAMTLGTLTYNNPGGRSINGTGTLRFWANSGNALFHTTTSSGYLDPSISRIILTTSTEFRIQGSTRVDISSPISGSGNLAKTGAQELRLNSGNSTYRGVTSISGGVLSGDVINYIGEASSFGVGNFAISGGATLRYTGLSAANNRTFTLGSGNGWIDVSNSGTSLTVSGVMSGPGGLGKTGAGILQLNANNTYTGNTHLSGGTIRLGASERIPNSSTVTLTSGRFNLNGFSETVGAVSSSIGNVTIDGGTLIANGQITINDSGTIVVGSGTFAANRRLVVGEDTNGVFHMLPNSRVVARNVDGGDSLYIGRSGYGVFNQTEGLLEVDTPAYLGIETGSRGTYNFSGGDATFASSVHIGRDGTGIVNHSGSADAGIAILSLGTNAEGVGQYIKTGGTLDVQQAFVGYAGTGTFEQTAGTTTADRVLIGHLANSHGRFLLGDETLTNNALNVSVGLFVGDGGSGELDQVAGSVTVDNELSLGRAAGGDGTYQMTGGSLTVHGVTYVGRSGNGVFTLDDGSVVSRNNLRIAENNGSVSSLTIQGGSLDVVNNSGLHVGANGNGKVLQSGGQVSVAGEVYLGLGETSVGTYSLSGGVLDVSAGQINFGSGTGSFEFTGGTLHVGTYNGNLQNEGGILAPGKFAGLTTINGDYSQITGAALAIDIGGVLAGSTFDAVSVAGTANLAGDLMLSLVDGFLPTATDFFTVLHSNSILGSFGNVLSGSRVATVDGLGSFQVNYGLGSGFSPNQIVLSGFALETVGLPGDFDLDGDVDGRDFLAWQRDPSIGDLSDWQANYGFIPPTDVLTAVPEPATLITVVLTLLSLCSRCRWISS